MPIYQAFNKRIDAYVKYHFTEKGFTPTDVKQVNPTVPFKNIPIRQRR